MTARYLLDVVEGSVRCSSMITGSFTVSWIIPDFTKLERSSKVTVRSPSFHPQNILDTKCDAPEEGVTATYSISFRTAAGKSIWRGENRTEVFHANEERGYSETVNRNDLESVLSDNTLVFFIELIFSIPTVVVNNDVSFFSGMTPFAKLIEDVKSLGEKGSDMILTVKGVDIPVHTILLGKRSKVFEAMFRHDTLESTTRRVEIDDFDPDVVKSFIEFIYGGTVTNIDVSLATELLRAADKYDVEDLKLYVSNFLISQLNDDNVLMIAAAADAANHSILKKKAIDHFCESSTKIDLDKHSEFIENADKNLLIDLINCLKSPKLHPDVNKSINCSKSLK